MGSNFFSDIKFKLDSIKLSNVNEGKTWYKDGVEMCSKECCGQPVTECTCGPECKHCNCYEKNNSEVTNEDMSNDEIDAFHRALDALVHKHLGHGSHEKDDEVNEAEALTEEQFDEAAGEKDACYHKVKSRYKVWPSAYASGALVQCRKVGASNWGNKSKK